MLVKDLVCGMTIEATEESVSSSYQGTTYYFCSKSCREKFDKAPENFVGQETPSQLTEEIRGGALYTCPMHLDVRQAVPGACPKCGMALETIDAVSASVGHGVRRSILVGVAGAVGLVLFYVILVGLLSASWRHPLDELLELKYLIGALVLGFGTQVGLFYHIRHVMHVKGRGGNAVAAGTGASTVAMVACCAHHITDVLPIIGLAGVALFLSEYKIAFITFGIISNTVGIVIMLLIVSRSAERRVSDRSAGSEAILARRKI